MIPFLQRLCPHTFLVYTFIKLIIFLHANGICLVCSCLKNNMRFILSFLTDRLHSCIGNGICINTCWSLLMREEIRDPVCIFFVKAFLVLLCLQTDQFQTLTLYLRLIPVKLFPTVCLSWRNLFFLLSCNEQQLIRRPQ